MLTLAVYHRSDNVEQHVAELRAATGMQLELVRKGTLWNVPNDVSGVLWELALEDGAQRLVPALIGNLPAASYGAPSQPGLLELSRALGFHEHLTLPLLLDDVERALGLREMLDLADRIDGAAPRLLQMAAQPEVIGSIVRAVNVAASDPALVAAAIVAKASDWLPLSEWHLFAVEPDGAPHRLGDKNEKVANQAAAHSFAELIVQTGQPSVRVTNYLDERLDGSTRPPRVVEASCVGWPLIANGATVGVLVGFDPGRARRLPTVSQALADAMVRLLEPAAFALANALRVARAEALSVTDDLTQLYNSRYLNDALRKETKRAMRSGWPLSLLFVDLDGFKRINDVNGHLLGNRGLIEAADVIKNSARETDIVARFGGDEFAILLPETGVEGAQSVARRLRDRIQRFDFLADYGTISRLTASIGIATLPDVADSAEALLQAADAAMYRVKMTGKNGIHIAGSENGATGLPAEEQELS
ncbi:MAG: GGDEF domain-containing protein [Acidobacteriota bacterium]